MSANTAAPARDTILLAGPTASGKSRLAMDLARRHGGIVINADSMQVYRDLPILTARPTPDDEAAVAHRLYGLVPAAQRYSVGRWLGDIAGVLSAARAAGHMVVVTGGTGLYFRALTEGLAVIPQIPDSVRDDLAEQCAGLSSAVLHERLAAEDPVGAARIRTSDRARLLRALEVFRFTGRSLVAWQEAEPPPPLVAPGAAARVVLMPDRAILGQRIAERADRMVTAGGLAEVEALMGLELEPSLPAMKAIGVRELAAHLHGEASLDDALTIMKTRTRQYAKRQSTWFRNQMADWRFVTQAHEVLDLQLTPA